jgi:hypothetical protein
MRPLTISGDYLALQRKLHENPNYGVASTFYAPIVAQVLARSRPRSISDYGAGKQNLRKALEQLGVSGYDYHPFDPAFPEYGEPQSADLVCCIDVLEHIEPEFVDAVIEELATITVKLGFFTIATGPAGKTLADGRNAHLIQKPSSWWLPKLCAYFEIAQLSRDQHGLIIVVEPRSTPA